MAKISFQSNQSDQDLVEIADPYHHDDLLESHENSGSIIYKPILDNEIIQTEQIQIKVSRKKFSNFKKSLSKICHLSKNLYNVANYEIREKLFSDKNFDGPIDQSLLYSYENLYHKLKSTNAFRQLPAQSAQQNLRTVIKNWEAYFAAAADYKINPWKYTEEPQIPGFKRKNGEWLVIFTGQQCHIKNGYLKFPKRVDIPEIKTRFQDGTINQVRVLPRGEKGGDVYVVEIIYEKNVNNLHLDTDRAISIDLGLNNLATVVNNTSLQSGIIKGGVIKSINQYYNKLKAQYQSIKDKQGYTFQTKRLDRMALKRNNRINDIFHKISQKLINYCILGNFGTIVFGYNPNWKQAVELGKRNNQNFVNIPYRKFIDLITYKAGLLGIQVIEVTEYFTSKCSALDLEKICRHSEYLGKRVQRGLFQTKDGTIINADVNGALNILRLVVGDGFIGNQTDKRCWLRPKRWKIYEKFQSNSNCQVGKRNSNERASWSKPLFGDNPNI